MIDVVRDVEGVRMALEEIFEEDYARSRIEREIEGADADTRRRMQARLPRRTLSPGYYAFAEHVLRLERLQKAGIQFRADSMPGYECDALLAVGRARTAFECRHPKCASCGANQQNCFGVKCHACGANFERS